MLTADEEKWQQAVHWAEREFARLDPMLRDACCAILAEMVRVKEAMYRYSDGAGGADICRACGGSCCTRGKYYLTLPDLLGLFSRKAPLPVPRFDRFPQCPYLGDAGCQIAPELRPFTCVIFNCDLIEGKLSESDRSSLYALERRLREHYASLEVLFGRHLMGGVLGSCDVSGGSDSSRQLQSW